MTKAAMVPGVAVAAVAATTEAIAAVYAASAFLYRLKVCYPLPSVTTVFSQRRCLCYQRHREEEQSSAPESALVYNKNPDWSLQWTWFLIYLFLSWHKSIEQTVWLKNWKKK